MSTQPEGTRQVMLRPRSECLFSMALLPGTVREDRAAPLVRGGVLADWVRDGMGGGEAWQKLIAT
jgi:hypothetical protein